jgi:hypothetical protein
MLIQLLVAIIVRCCYFVTFESSNLRILFQIINLLVINDVLKSLKYV